MVPVDVQGASSSTASNSLPGAQVAASASTRSAWRCSRSRLPRRRARRAADTLDRGDVGTGRGELGGLAARRRAQIGDAAAGDVAEQASGERGGGILHPPGSLGVAGKVLDAAAGGEPHRSRRQRGSRRAARPRGGVGFHAEIERRLARATPARCGAPPPRRRSRSSGQTAKRGYSAAPRPDPAARQRLHVKRAAAPH